MKNNYIILTLYYLSNPIQPCLRQFHTLQGDEGTIAKRGRVAANEVYMAPAQGEEGYYVHIGSVEKEVEVMWCSTWCRHAYLIISVFLFQFTALRSVVVAVGNKNYNTSVDLFSRKGLIMFQQRIALTAFPSVLADHRCFADKSSDRVLGMKLVEADMMRAKASANPIILVVSLASYYILGASVIPICTTTAEERSHSIDRNSFSYSTGVPRLLQCPRGFLHGDDRRK